MYFTDSTAKNAPQDAQGDDSACIETEIAKEVTEEKKEVEEIEVDQKDTNLEVVDKLDEPCELQLSMSSNTSMDSESKLGISQEPVKITEPLSEDTEIQIGAKQTEADAEESKEDGIEGD